MSATEELDTTEHIESINIKDRGFFFGVSLYNIDGDVIPVKKASIEELVLEDDINNFFHKGYITIDNHMDSIERVTIPELDNKTLFRFRGDGRDYVIIEIMPQVTSDSDDQTKSNDDMREMFLLRFSFVVERAEDIPVDDTNKKLKKLHLRDLGYQLMTEKASFVHSALVQKDYNEGVKHINDEDRSAHTGDMIKEAINQAYGPDNVSFAAEFSSGRRLFHSSGFNDTIYDTITELLNYHVSDENNNFDPCFLKQERYTKDWSLMSMSDYFKNAYVSDGESEAAGSLHMDRYLIAGYDDQHELPRHRPKTPEGAVSIPDLSKIQSYVFETWSGEDNQDLLVTRLVNNYDGKNHLFSTDLLENDLVRCRDVFFENYTSHMKGKDGQPANSFNININKAVNLNYKSVYSTESDPTIRLSQGRNKSLMIGMMFNNTISFVVPGSSHRRSGRFISIDREDSYRDTEYDNKLLGIYFLINVKHIFIGNDYINQMLAVKPYFYQDPQYKEDVQ